MTDNELQLFICYRRTDGLEVANWLFNNLNQKKITRVHGNDEVVTTIKAYLDVAAPAISNWREFHQPALAASKAMLVVCTPGLFAELGSKDWTHKELDWWLSNRTTAPILVDGINEGDRWVPGKIKDRWPLAQRVDVKINDWIHLQESVKRQEEERVISRILEGIKLSDELVVFEELEQKNRLLKRTRSALLMSSIATACLVAACVIAVYFWLSIAEEKQIANNRLAQNLLGQADYALLKNDKITASVLGAQAYAVDSTEEIRDHYLSIRYWCEGKETRAAEHFRNVLDREYSRATNRDYEPLRVNRMANAATFRARLDLWMMLSEKIGNYGLSYDQVLRFKSLDYRLEIHERNQVIANTPGDLKAKIFQTEMELVELVYGSYRNLDTSSNWGDEFRNRSTYLSELNMDAYRLYSEQQNSTSQLEQYKWDEVQGSMKPGEVVIDFLLSNDEYIAWILKKDGYPIRVNLGSKAEINSQIESIIESVKEIKSRYTPPRNRSLRSGNNRGGRYARFENEESNEILKSNFWNKISPSLTEEDNILYLIPEGALGGVPFTALITSSDKYLIEEKSIAYLSSACEIIEEQEGQIYNYGNLLVGGLNYGPNDTVTCSRPPVENPSYLPDSKKEVEEIANIFKQRNDTLNLFLLKNTNGNERAIRSLSPKCRRLHFATHAWAGRQIGLNRLDQIDRNTKAGLESYFLLSDPLLRSGFVLSCDPDSSSYDGILTAMEVSRLELEGVELAVLAGCDTYGISNAEENVLGLYRAFREAGVDVVLSSIAEVTDQFTSNFMQSFYRSHIEEGKTIKQAYREALLQNIKEGYPPSQWSPFVLYGYRS